MNKINLMVHYVSNLLMTSRT